MINITKSILPELSDYMEKLKTLWKTRWLTNNGKFLLELESKLEERFNTKCGLITNGTIALLISLELFDFPENSEIITTPFTFIATVSSILWQKYKPVFVDVDPETFNINPEGILNKISPKTVAILAVHVFGNPCEIEKIEEISKKFKLKVIYDAAHCFDVFYKGQSLYKYGDVSIASFHATKIFHTIEGGGIFSDNEILIKKAKQLRNFGFDEKIEISEIGINAKMNEFQAIMGLLNLNFVENEINKRKLLYELYIKELSHLNVRFQKMNEDLTKYNYIYMPIILENASVREKVFENLKSNNINARKYFYPSLNEINIILDRNFPISSDISRRILQLPLYGELSKEDILRICNIITKTTRGGK